MLLSNLIASSDIVTSTDTNIEITGLSEDSRTIKPGFLFIATPGTKLDGRVFIGDAIRNGAVAVLLSHGSDISAPIPALITRDIRQTTAVLAATFYPNQPNTVVAVTGTSGKTSTVQFVRQLWQNLGHQSASIGTLGLATSAGTGYGSLTTPDSISLHRLLDNCTRQGITHVALEASSHGLDLHRLDQVHLKAGGFTNLSRDHLDYHQTMDAYFTAKSKLFSTLLPPGSVAVLNADIPEFGVLSEIATTHGLKVISYGKNSSDLRLLETRVDPHGQILHIVAWGKPLEVFLPLIGSFQAANALCAAGLVIGSGGIVDATIAALGKVSGVPGRLQLIGTSKKGARVFVDYAHKPDALENILHTLRSYVAIKPDAKLGVVFGCGGNRDKGKRPMMGKIAQQLADWVIITDDNPRFEDPSAIRSDILAGCAERTNMYEIGDRGQAIAAAIDRLGEHDILVIAGKGHEPGQTIGDKVLPFDDAEVARKAMEL